MIKKNTKKAINRRFITAFQTLEQFGTIRTRAEAAKILGILPQRLNDILQGRMNVGTDVLTNFFIYYRVNPDHIFMGSDSMLRPSSKKEAADYPMAAEVEPEYSRGKSGLRFSITKPDGSQQDRVVTVPELRELLGLDDLEHRLEAILRELRSAKKK